MSDYYYNVDPAFNDTSDFIECDICGSAFDHNEYKSATCSRCESNECYECQERLKKCPCPEGKCTEHKTCPSCELQIHGKEQAE